MYLALLLVLVLYVVTFCALAWKNSFAECWNILNQIIALYLGQIYM